MKILRIRQLLFVGGALATLVTAASAETKLRMLVSWTPSNAFIPHMADVFIRKVGEVSKGQLSVSRFGPEAVPEFQQLQPTTSGVFDLLYTVGAYHQATTGVGMVIDVVKNDSVQRRQTGVYAWFDAYYQRKFNLKVLSIAPHPGYQILLRDPVETGGDLQGRKIRSSPVYDGVVRALRGTPVTMPPSQAMAALQKGVIDGIAFPVMVAYGYKLYEFTKFMGRPAFGNLNTVFFMNLDKYKALSSDDRHFLEEAGRQMEVHGWEIGRKLEKDDVSAMMSKGVRITRFMTVSEAKLDALFNEGVISTASKSTPDDVKAFLDFVRSKGMLK